MVDKKIDLNKKIFIPSLFGKSRFKTYKYLTKSQKQLVNPKTLSIDLTKERKKENGYKK